MSGRHGARSLGRVKPKSERSVRKGALLCEPAVHHAERSLDIVSVFGDEIVPKKRSASSFGSATSRRWMCTESPARHASASNAYGRSAFRELLHKSADEQVPYRTDVADILRFADWLESDVDQAKPIND